MTLEIKPEGKEFGLCVMDIRASIDTLQRGIIKLHGAHECMGLRAPEIHAVLHQTYQQLVAARESLDMIYGETFIVP